MFGDTVITLYALHGAVKVDKSVCIQFCNMFQTALDVPLGFLARAQSVIRHHIAQKLNLSPRGENPALGAYIQQQFIAQETPDLPQHGFRAYLRRSSGVHGLPHAP